MQDVGSRQEEVETMKPFAALVAFCVLLLAGCRTYPTTHAHCRMLVDQIGYSAIYQAAVLSERDYMRGGAEYSRLPSPDIPSSYWHQPIPDLHPVRVYRHWFDLVIVLHETERTQVGLCITCPGASSWGGMSSDETVQLKAICSPQTGDPLMSSYVINKRPNKTGGR